ncbi:LrgB family protein [Enterovirga sp.]|uniref:LrgB family protein n=1 Tax=Enterovirga sp. TaxID=2026350 RepID=UPI002BD965C0|nr:LrgB family protein [Enterovirga sp.]HMO28356.1 LrgB family protein [Enterovirga sp.]
MNAFSLWVYLSASPLLWLTVTLIAWLVADALARAARGNAFVNPVLISIVLVGALLRLTGTPYERYFEGAQFVHFLLGPATVALGVPLYRNLALVRRNLLPMLAALLVGSLGAILSAVGIAAAFGLPREVIVSLAPKSVTAGIAMAISDSMGGVPSLTAAIVAVTGVVGAVVATPLMNALGIRDYVARGFAVGLSAHGIGTARAFTISSVAGVFAGIAMALNAVVTAFLVPLVLRFLP